LEEIELEAASKISFEDLPEHLRSEAIPRDILKTAQMEGLLLVASENGNTPIGFAVAKRVESYLHLLEIDVLPRIQRRGIGSMLLDSMIRIAFQHDCQWVSLTTFSHLPWNAPWYDKMGFEKIQTKDMPDFLINILVQEKELGLNPNLRVAMRKRIKIETS